MTFLEIQNEVLADRFAESLRPSVKNWINFRYARLWGSNKWTFKLQTTSLHVPQGTQSISKGTIGDIISITDNTLGTGYDTVYAYRPEEFFEKSTATAATPSAYTVIGDFIWFNAPLDTARIYQVVSEKTFTTLTADSDVPLIPTPYHQALVHGAAVEGLIKENDPAYQGEEAQYQQAVDDLKSEYLSSATYYSHLPSWP